MSWGGGLVSGRGPMAGPVPSHLEDAEADLGGPHGGAVGGAQVPEALLQGLPVEGRQLVGPGPRADPRGERGHTKELDDDDDDDERESKRERKGEGPWKGSAGEMGA